MKNNLDAYKYERANRLKASQAVVHFVLIRLGVIYKKMLDRQKADKKERAMFLKNRTI